MPFSMPQGGRPINRSRINPKSKFSPVLVADVHESYRNGSLSLLPLHPGERRRQRTEIPFTQVTHHSFRPKRRKRRG